MTMHRAASLVLDRRRRRPTRRGSTLILALLLVIVLSSAVAGLYGMLGSERKALGDQEAQAGAYDIARSAYDRFIANSTGALAGFSPPAWTGPDSAYFSFTNGYAYVRVQRVYPSMSGKPAMYLVSSRGVRTAFRSGNTPAAERIYAQYALFSTGTMNTLAAWTSLSGLQKSGGSGTISGSDACGQSAAVGGVAVPTVPGYVQSGGSSVPSGSPNIVDMGPQPSANALVKINWSGIVGGTALAPDITIPGGSWPSFSSPTYWPVIYVNQVSEWSLPGDGRGLLIVRNDLKLPGAVKWDGILLVGGRLTSSGNNTISGAVVSGLNELLGQVVPPNDVGSGNKTFVYNSCDVASAVARFTGLAPLRNTTIDNWPSY
jgi:hypothetical protein